jgi:hypothetical protein
MARSITVGTVELWLTSFQERQREWRGEATRSFDHTLQDGRDLPKRAWDGTTDWLSPADEAALRLAIGGGPVVCFGIVLVGEAVLCTVDVESAPRGPDVQSGAPDWTEINVTLALTFREV